MEIDPDYLGQFKRPIAFTFSNSGIKDNCFHIVRNVSVNFQNRTVQELQPKIPYKKPKRKTEAAPRSQIVDGVRLTR